MWRLFLSRNIETQRPRSAEAETAGAAASQYEIYLNDVQLSVEYVQKLVALVR
jgi:hypothetical protein